MKKINYMKTSVLLCLLSIMVYATNSSSENLFGTINKGLTSAEEAAQSGRQVMDAGTTAATMGAGQTGLTDILMSQLGVSQQQALGGAGAIFQAAQGNMDSQAFSTLSQSVPGINEMLGAAPVMSDSTSSLTGGLSSLMGDSNNSLGSVAALTSSFQQLDLSPDMVGRFVPILTNYVKETGGQVSADLLQSALNLP